MDRPVHIVGGGIAGLVAAITAAEAGAPVVLHEAADRLGGRALGGTDRPGVNLGPHVVFTDGALVRWLRAHDFDVPMHGPQLRRLRVLDDGGTGIPVRLSLQLAPTLLPRDAPVDQAFEAWAEEAFGSGTSRLLCRFAGLFTYHHDPGVLSAKFVWDRYRRTILSPDHVRWIVGGWSTLIGALATRAQALGIEIALGERMTRDELPGAPTIVATKLTAASRLLDRPLRWPGTRTALLDLVTTSERQWPAVVADVRSDLATCCMIERETAMDRSVLGGEDGELIQAQLGIGPDVSTADGLARIEDGLDESFAGWRDEALWRRGQVVVDATGAVDPPGATWRDRPAVDQGDDVYLAGDAVAAPGMLSEVAVNSGVQAARLALDARRRRAFAPGWPSVELTPDRRLAVLAAALSRADVRTAVVPDSELEPVDETGPGYRLESTAGVVQGTAVDGLRVTTLTASRWPDPVSRAVRGLLAVRRTTARGRSLLWGRSTSRAG